MASCALWLRRSSAAYPRARRASSEVMTRTRRIRRRSDTRRIITLAYPRSAPAGDPATVTADSSSAMTRSLSRRNIASSRSSFEPKCR